MWQIMGMVKVVRALCAVEALRLKWRSGTQTFAEIAKVESRVRVQSAYQK